MELPDGFIPQLIALDIDDTLIQHDGPVPHQAVDAIARVQDMGIMVVASTGRSKSTTTPVCRAAGMLDWAVCSNGALLAHVEPEEVVDAITFDPTELLIEIEKRVPNGSYGVESVSGLFRTNLSFSHAALTEEVREVPFEELMSEPVDPPGRAQRRAPRPGSRLPRRGARPALGGLRHR